MSKRKSPVRKRLYWINGDYWACEDGRIWNGKYKKYLHPFDKNGIGYLYLALPIDGKFKQQLVHRLICRAFHGEPPTPKHEVNHIDGNKHNNRISNLQWVTRLENMQHAWEHKLATPLAEFNEPRKIPVIGVNRYGKVICYFESIRAAERGGYKQENVRKAINNGTMCKGLYWKELDKVTIVI